MANDNENSTNAEPPEQPPANEELPEGRYVRPGRNPDGDERPREPLTVRLDRPARRPTADQVLWVLIRNRTKAISFDCYARFMDSVMCRTAEERDGFDPPDAAEQARQRRKDLREAWWGTKRYDGVPLRYHGADAYELLRHSTEAFLMQECGLAIAPGASPDLDDVDDGDESQPPCPPLDLKDEASRLGREITLEEIQQERREYLERLSEELEISTLPYLRTVIERLGALPTKPADLVPPSCYGILRSRATGPCLLELIWSYWHEQGMLVQTLKAISLRFQNSRTPATERLARFDVDPLRPLNNLLWGFIQTERRQLSLPRRVYEYDHHYGLTLAGKAVPQIKSIDSRPKFLGAFHNLLHTAVVFFKEDDNTMKIADPFPVLNAVKELHLVLAQGAHNQFGDLPWTARVEMMAMQWLLARREMREFLRGRPMVPYSEGWMEQVDAMNMLQGWQDTTATHFRDLGVFGEQLLLSVRYGNWADVVNADQAANWARYWRSEILGYIHAYRAVTGVDLAATDERSVRLRTSQPTELMARSRNGKAKRRGG